MAQLPINYGAAANDGTGTNWRTAFQRIQDNFTDIYALQSRIVNAGDVRFSGEATTEAKIQAAIDQAVTELATAVFVPAVLLPYDASLVTFNSTVRMVREGGDFSVFDVRAYGADATGVLDAGTAWNKARAAVPAAGGPMRVPFGTYKLTTAFTFGGQSNIAVLIDPGVTLTGEALPVPAVSTNNTYIDYRSGFKFTGVAPFHVVRQHSDVPASQLNADTNYVFVGKSKDAVMLLVSDREGDHGSGIQLAEVEPVTGVYNDEWTLTKTSSTPSGGQMPSALRWEYGTSPDYTVGAKVFEMTPYGGLWMGTASVVATRTRGLSVATELTDGTVVAGIVSKATADSEVTGEMRAIEAQCATKAQAFTCGAVMALKVLDAVEGAGSTILAQYGLYVDSQTKGNSGFNYAIFTNTGKCRFGDVLELPEIAEPSAPGADRGFLYVKDNGSGKSQLCVRFPTGAVQVVATEP